MESFAEPNDDDHLISEELFLSLFRGNEQQRFEFELVGGEIYVGYVARRDLSSDAGPQKQIYLCSYLPYEGDARSDPSCIQIRLDRIWRMTQVK